MVKFDLRLEENSECVKKKLDCKLGYIFGIIYVFQRKERQLLKENNERVKKKIRVDLGLFTFFQRKGRRLLKENNERVRKEEIRI